MEIWRLLAVIISTTVLACSVQGMSFTLDTKHWISKNWEDNALVDTLARDVASIVKRSKAHQFYGLMGKRTGNKGEKFVGLMGRSLRGDTFTRTIPAETSSATQSDKQSGAAFKITRN
ncbi:hypothetical protein Baya_0518 [Bagarius yarrelli]|uniref:Uncharacterized protein n=1 Tax=Bagarius yarrelli TaxID=175774 RepID=A0A556TII6_BAGYA|nr:hypothetical protein Baya_0518 [Bagarius yarrelli]